MKQKDRKHSGRVFPRPTIPKKALIENDLFLEEYWDDWNDYRDGMRGYDDHTKINNKIIEKERWRCFADENIERYNKKNKKLILRRKAKKNPLRCQV